MTGICQIDYTASPPGRVCQSCTDGVRGGEETDVDCGGSGCEPCNADGTRKRALHFTLPFLAFLRSKARAFHYIALPFLLFPPIKHGRFIMHCLSLCFHLLKQHGRFSLQASRTARKPA